MYLTYSNNKEYKGYKCDDTCNAYTSKSLHQYWFQVLLDFVVTVLDSNPVTFVCLLLFLTFKTIYDRSFIEDSRNIFFALRCQTFIEIRVMCRRSNSFDNISLQNLRELVFRTCVQNLYRILKINKNAVKLVLFQCKKRINSELKSRI